MFILNIYLIEVYVFHYEFILQIWITVETSNKELWYKEQSPLIDPRSEKWQIRDFWNVRYLHENFKKISLKTDQNRNDRH